MSKDGPKHTENDEWWIELTEKRENIAKESKGEGEIVLQEWTL